MISQSEIEAVCREVPPTLGGILRALAETQGRYLPTSQLAAAVYCGTPDGGPDHAGATVATTIWKQRDRIRKRGLDIESKIRGGYRLVRAA